MFNRSRLYLCKLVHAVEARDWLYSNLPSLNWISKVGNWWWPCLARILIRWSWGRTRRWTLDDSELDSVIVNQPDLNYSGQLSDQQLWHQPWWSWIIRNLWRHIMHQQIHYLGYRGNSATKFPRLVQQLMEPISWKELLYEKHWDSTENSGPWKIWSKATYKWDRTNFLSKTFLQNFFQVCDIFVSWNFCIS